MNSPAPVAAPAVTPTANPKPATGLRAAERPANLRAGLEPLSEVADEIRALDQALADLSEEPGAALRERFNSLRAELAAFEPSVTLLGQVKSGKTTLVNAMAGWADLLPSDVNPWTSVVTALHLSPDDAHHQTSASFRFMTEGEWDRLLHKGGRIGEMAGRAGAESELQKIHDQIATLRARAQNRLGRKFELLMGQSHDYGYFDKNLIERYICLGDDWDIARAPADTPDAGSDAHPDQQGRFADITRSADLYLGCDMLPCRLCLRDTPGVNDTFMMREQITIQALRESRQCVVVLSASQALSSVDLGLIRMLSTLQSQQVVIFVNRIDELSDPAAQIPEIETSIRATLAELAGDQAPRDPKIIFGSAYWAARVLTGETEAMVPAASAALLNWAEDRAQAAETQPRLAAVSTAQEMIWELSGLPALFQALSERIAEQEARPMLRHIAEAASTLASGQDAAHEIAIAAGQNAPLPEGLASAALIPALTALRDRHLAAFDSELSTVLAAFTARADRAHETFLERATHALIAHLEEWGDGSVWTYEPAGLRMLLRSAYSVMGNRVQTLARDRYEQAISEAAALFYAQCGDAVAGIRLAVPMPPEAGAPVALAQAIALDFNDSWWTGWWRRMRGYQAFAKTFRRLIESETEDFMTQLKTVQTATLRQDTRARLEESFAALLAIAAELETAGEAPAAVRADTGPQHGPHHEPLHGTDTSPRHAALRHLATLTD